jgi:hypothetical protein
MTEFPTSLVPGKIKALFERIPEIGVPPKADKTWLKTLGYTSGNDYSLVVVLKFLGFIDSSNVPTDKWQVYRSCNDKKAALGSAVKEGYSELFSLFPKANTLTDAELANFFKTKSKGGQLVIRRLVATLRALFQSASFNGEEQAQQVIPTSGSDTTMSLAQVNANTPNVPSGHNPVVINVNIQLTLPETTNAELLQNLFAAMKSNLWVFDVYCGNLPFKRSAMGAPIR